MRWPFDDADEAAWADPDVPDLEVTCTDPEPVGVLLDAHGDIVCTVMPDRPPFGFNRT